MTDGRPWVDRLPYRREPTEEELARAREEWPKEVLLAVARVTGLSVEVLCADVGSPLLEGVHDTGEEEIGREEASLDPETADFESDRPESP